VLLGVGVWLCRIVAAVAGLVLPALFISALFISNCRASRAFRVDSRSSRAAWLS
jgi:hypothetical protein